MKILKIILEFFFSNNSDILRNLVEQTLENVGEKANWLEIMKGIK